MLGVLAHVPGVAEQTSASSSVADAKPMLEGKLVGSAWAGAEVRDGTMLFALVE